MTTVYPTLVRLKPMLAATGDSKSTLYVRITQGLWPPPVKLGPRSVAWPSTEIAAINSARIAGESDDAIRKLVLQLVRARSAASRTA
jgi:prophage regulatory protein